MLKQPWLKVGGTGMNKSLGSTGTEIWGGVEREPEDKFSFSVSRSCEKANFFSWLQPKWFLPPPHPFWGLSHVTLLLLAAICRWLFCSLAHCCFGVVGSSSRSVATLSFVWRSRLAIVPDAEVGVGERCLRLLIQSYVMNGACHPPTSPSSPARSHSAVIQL